MRWKVETGQIAEFLWRAGIVALILSSLLSYLLVLGAFQGFQEDSMGGLFSLLRVSAWFGLGTLLNWSVLSKKAQTHKGVLFLLLILTAEEFWASFWKAWLYA